MKVGFIWETWNRFYIPIYSQHNDDFECFLLNSCIFRRLFYSSQDFGGFTWGEEETFNPLDILQSPLDTKLGKSLYE